MKSIVVHDFPSIIQGLIFDLSVAQAPKSGFLKQFPSKSRQGGFLNRYVLASFILSGAPFVETDHGNPTDSRHD